MRLANKFTAYPTNSVLASASLKLDLLGHQNKVEGRQAPAQLEQLLENTLYSVALWPKAIELL